MSYQTSRHRPATRMIVAVAAVLFAVSTFAGDDPAPPQAAAAQPPAAAATPAIDPRAEELVRAASKFLTAAKSLSFTAEVWEDVVSEGGRKLQSQRTTDVAIRRPDRIVAHARSERKSRDAYYDGKSLTIYNPDTHFYGVMNDVPKNIDDTVDFVAEKFGVSLPLSDLITSDIPGSLVKDVRRGDYLGRQRVAGIDCHHLGFTQENIDWQIWIEEGDQPLIRRVIITYKSEPQSPQFSATITHWRIDPPLPDYAFQFRAPACASKIDVLPAAQTPSSPPTGAGDPNLARDVQPPAAADNAKQPPPPTRSDDPNAPKQEKSK